MKRMLVRNKVKDFDVWKTIFDEQLAAAGEHGLKLENLWRVVDDPNNVFFIFTIDDLDRAHAFLNAPSSAEAGERSGVIDGEFWIVE